MRFLSIFFSLTALPAFATAYDRPIPQAQSATAEFWYTIASLTLLAALFVVYWLVQRR